MTNQELNRDVKRLYKTLKSWDKKQPSEEYLKYIDNVARKEFIRLRNADTSMMSLNRDNVLRMLKMNVSYRFYPLHLFSPQTDKL